MGGEFGKDLLCARFAHILHKRLGVKLRYSDRGQASNIDMTRDVRNGFARLGFANCQFPMGHKFDDRDAGFAGKIADQELALKSSPPGWLG